jgi:hypothetical protein
MTLLIIAATISATLIIVALAMTSGTDGAPEST